MWLRKDYFCAYSRAFFRIKINTGHTFWVDPFSRFGIALIKQGIYEPQMTFLLQLVLRRGDTFVDAGANEGYFSILASSLVGEKGKVYYIIEPQGRLQQVALANIKANNASQIIETAHSALYNKDGKITLRLAPLIDSGPSGAHYRKIFFGEKRHLRLLLWVRSYNRAIFNMCALSRLTQRGWNTRLF